jgi:hypothetical protein
VKGNDPLDAVKPFLAGDGDARRLADNISADTTSEAPAKSSVLSTACAVHNDPPLVVDMDAMNASIAAAGLELSSQGSPSSGHGLSVPRPSIGSDVIAR